MAKAAENQASIVARTPVTASGIDLLALIKASETGYLMLTQSEGAAIVAAGQAAIDQNVQLTDQDKSDGVVPVVLTALGEAALAAQPGAVAAEKAKRASVTVGAISKSVPPPVIVPGQRKERGSKYPFDTLEIGDSFHMPATLENVNPLASVQSALIIAKEKYSKPVFNEDGSPKMETVTEKTYAKDADGKIIKDAEGHRVVAETKTVERQVTEPTRSFVAAAVGADDPDGVGARVWRIAL